MDDMAGTESVASGPRGGRSRRNEEGASLVEYAFLVALIAMACLLAVQILGGSVDDSLSSSGSQVSNAGN